MRAQLRPAQRERPRTHTTDFRALIDQCIGQTLLAMHYQKVAIAIKFHATYNAFVRAHALQHRQDLLRAACAAVLHVSESALLIPVAFAELQRELASVAHAHRMKGEEQMVRMLTEREVRHELRTLLATLRASATSLNNPADQNNLLSNQRLIASSLSSMNGNHQQLHLQQLPCPVIVRHPADPQIAWSDAFTSYLNRVIKYLLAAISQTSTANDEQSTPLSDLSSKDLAPLLAKLSLDSRKINALATVCRTQLAQWMQVITSPTLSLISSSSIINSSTLDTFNPAINTSSQSADSTTSAQSNNLPTITSPRRTPTTTTTSNSSSHSTTTGGYYAACQQLINSFPSALSLNTSTNTSTSTTTVTINSTTLTPPTTTTLLSTSPSLTLTSPLTVLSECPDMPSAFRLIRHLIAHLFIHALTHADTLLDPSHTSHTTSHIHHHPTHHTHTHTHARRTRTPSFPVEKTDQKKRRLMRRAIAIECIAIVTFLCPHALTQFEQDLEQDLLHPLSNIGQYMLTRTATASSPTTTSNPSSTSATPVPPHTNGNDTDSTTVSESPPPSPSSLARSTSNNTIVPTTTTPSSTMSTTTTTTTTQTTTPITTLPALPVSLSTSSSSALAVDLSSRSEVACSCGGTTCRGRCDTARLWTALAKLSCYNLHNDNEDDLDDDIVKYDDDDTNADLDGRTEWHGSYSAA